jgi:hypothetical protein
MNKNKPFAPPELLKDKGNILTQRLTLPAFEYMLAGISKSYTLSQRYQDIPEFNKKNKLSLYKAIVFPFFVALSNGNSNSLYSLFGPFYPFVFGPASDPIHRALRESSKQNSNLSFFTFNEAPNYGVTIKDGVSDFSTLKDKISNQSISLSDNDSFRLKDVKIYDDNNNERFLLDAIDNGIDIITKASDNLFFAMNESKIINQANNFWEFRKHYLGDLEESEIEYKEVLKDRSPKYYSDLPVLV